MLFKCKNNTKFITKYYHRYYSSLSNDIKYQYHILSDLHLEYNQDVTCLKSLINKYPSLNSIQSYKKRYGIFTGINNKIAHVPEMDPLITSSNNSMFDLKVTQNKIFILAGDVGNPYKQNYWSFLKDLSEKYAYVIITTGNHEYYNMTKYTKNTMPEINNFIKTNLNRICNSTDNDNNIIFLNRDSKIINGINYIGATLWTHIPINFEKILDNGMSDYKYIYHTNNTLLTAKKSNLIHSNDVEFIKQSIHKNIKNIVITHHLPIPELSHPKYNNYGILQYGFFSDLRKNKNDIFESQPKVDFTNINLWICGHTHTPMHITDSQTHFIANPLGFQKRSLPHILNIDLDELN